MIFSMIEKERFEKVLEEGSKLMNMSKEDFQRTMETDFMAAFVTGYYGHGVLMGNAAKRYFEEIETELFAHEPVGSGSMTMGPVGGRPGAII